MDQRTEQANHQDPVGRRLGFWAGWLLSWKRMKRRVRLTLFLRCGRHKVWPEQLAYLVEQFGVSGTEYPPHWVDD